MIMGSVYFVRMGDASMFKIGYCSTNPRKRLEQLQIGNPYRLSYFGFINSLCAKDVESTLHREFRDSNESGEWFSISESQATDAILRHGGILYGDKMPDWPEIMTRKSVQNTCVVCGKVWVSSKRALTCNASCRTAKSRMIRAAKLESMKRTCLVCGCSFVALRRDASTCSPRCRTAKSRRLKAAAA